MKLYPDRIPAWLPYFLSSYYWHGNRDQKRVYLTFDDGPTPEVTDFVLDQLAHYHAKASFFCIGDRVARHQDLMHRILEQGHAIGNHTHNHLNAWKTKSDVYLENIETAAQLLPSKLFRPPYGRITPGITRALKEKGYQIILWDVLSGDFDQSRSANSCYQNLIRNTQNGSVIVFHDSEKCFDKLQKILPQYLKYLQENGWKSKGLEIN